MFIGEFACLWAFLIQRWYTQRKQRQDRNASLGEGLHDPLIRIEHSQQTPSTAHATGSVNVAPVPPEPQLTWRSTLITIFPAMLDVTGTTLCVQH